LVHAIEAACAYSRRQNYDPITDNGIARLMNVYHDFTDPMQIDSLKGSFHHFMHLLYREQIELQYQQSRDALARDLTIFAGDGSLPKSAKAFEARFGLTPFQWIKLSFIAATAADQNPNGLFNVRSILGFEHLDMPESAVRAYFSLSSSTVDEIGKRFKES